MLAVKSNVWLPDPFENLLRFADSGCVRIVAAILSADKKWLDENLDEEGRDRRNRIAAQLNEWKEIEGEYGEGSALNTEHKVLWSLVSRSEGLRHVYEARLTRARQYKELKGRNWLWLQS